jgi:lipoprotein-anchoring transpeptidase ErfK/SrfK
MTRLRCLKLRKALILLVALAASAGAAPAHGQDPPDDPEIAEGVRIAGLAVGGLTESEARQAVQAHFDRPLKFRFRARRWQATPGQLGARAYVDRAVARALAAEEGEAITLRVRLDGPRIRAYVRYLDRGFSRPARDSTVLLRRLRPYVTPPRKGIDVRFWPMTGAIVRALTKTYRGPIALRAKILTPRVTRANVGPVVVIHRGSRRLYLYRGTGFVRRFSIAVGMPRYPTPLGRFTIVRRERNPTWDPPNSDWAAGLGPVPPGPGNPLGTRWMGLSAPGIGIHGTPAAYSIGTAASHGCIRMYIREAEWLFARVRVGTPVFIVRA